MDSRAAPVPGAKRLCRKAHVAAHQGYSREQKREPNRDHFHYKNADTQNRYGCLLIISVFAEQTPPEHTFAAGVQGALVAAEPLSIFVVQEYLSQFRYFGLQLPSMISLFLCDIIESYFGCDFQCF